MSTTPVMTDEELLGIREARNDFDIDAPLNEQELAMLGQMSENQRRLTALKEAGERIQVGERPQVIDEDLFGEVEEEAPVDGENYNARYAHYLKCQAITTLVSFEEGWKAFEELILNAYLKMRRKENASYRGEDPNKALALRLRQQEAEDFVKAIHNGVEEAAALPKPALAVKSLEK